VVQENKGTRRKNLIAGRIFTEERTTKRPKWSWVRTHSRPCPFYNELVIDHCTNPRHVGEILNADVFAQLGDPFCGDWMKLWIKLDSIRIANIKFLTSGCAGAIATSSMTTVLAKGKTIEDAKKIINADVILAFE